MERGLRPHGVVHSILPPSADASGQRGITACWQGQDGRARRHAHIHRRRRARTLRYSMAINVCSAICAICAAVIHICNGPSGHAFYPSGAKYPDSLWLISLLWTLFILRCLGAHDQTMAKRHMSPCKR